MTSLSVYHKLPDGLFSLPIQKLHDFLGGPSLFNLKGQSEKTLFISTLLHGNETSGFLALKRFFDKHSPQDLPVSLCLFLGNTLAAGHGQRHLPEQRDWNRIWSPEELPECPEKNLAREVLNYASQLPLFANIDIHNNTGNNPPYGCINYLDKDFLKLAKLFHEKVIYFTEPHEVQSMKFGEFCPSMTIEAGLPGEEQGISLILDFLENLIQCHDLKSLSTPTSLDLYHTIARVKIPSGSQVNFEDDSQSFCDFSLRRDLESLNFCQVQPHTHWGYAKRTLEVEHFEGEDIFPDYFTISEGKLVNKKAFTPCMLTRNTEVLQSDCLCYLMEKMKL